MYQAPGPAVPPSGGSGGKIAAIVVAVVLLLVCCGCGAFVALRPDAVAGFLAEVTGSR